MGTEVLHPQDCLNQRIAFTPTVFHRRKSFLGNGNPRPNNHHHRKPILRPDQRKRSPEPSIPKRSASSEDLRHKSNNKHNQNNLLLGQVTILKRGESLDAKIKSETVQAKNNGDELIISGTERLGPSPEMVPKQIKLSSVPSGGSFRPDMYAGSAFSLSPSPSSLPLPSFFSKKKVSEITDASATRDLRRLLRLD
ncbi:hypothetical protein LguiA_031122 [Lonicera macranthoides]